MKIVCASYNNAAFYKYTDKNMNVIDCETNQRFKKGLLPQQFIIILHFTLHVD